MSRARPKCVDLFAGAGGLGLGFEYAGFDVAAAVEIDPVHAATHLFNFPECRVMPQSVVGLSGRAIRDRLPERGQPIDVVFGGAPCQGFSLIGQRAMDDPRNSLVREFVRIVAELEPPHFVFENVKGLTLGSHRQFLDELISAFRKIGYEVRLPWRVLNAASYGVPQDRERLFLLGAKRGCVLPAYPEATTAFGGDADCFLAAGPTCGDALDDLPDAENFPELMNTDEVPTDAWGKPVEYAARLRGAHPDAWRFAHRRTWEPNLLTSSLRTVHTAISRRRFAETPPGRVEPISRFYRLPKDGVCNTLRAGTDSARGAFTSPRPIHYGKPRCITVREMARLHSFPDWFRFHETKWHGARQIGNSVPPLLGLAVAQEIARAMDYQPAVSNHTLPPGDPTLLRMDMSEAARFWGVPVTIGRRDRKSGAKKRKQSEIEIELLKARSGNIHG